jgi:hypothetical protein
MTAMMTVYASTMLAHTLTPADLRAKRASALRRMERYAAMGNRALYNIAAADYTTVDTAISMATLSDIPIRGDA